MLLLGAVAGSSCGTRAGAIRAVIHPDEETRATAMRAAPVVAVVRMTGVRLTGDERLVEKPPGTAGLQVDRIPLHLARMDAEVVLPVRGEAGQKVTFYSWVWNSGQHGGPRLFQPVPGSIHVMFLDREGEYWHTVGDYPYYDIPLRAEWVSAIVRAWEVGERREAEPLHRLTALRLQAELGVLTEVNLREAFGGGSGMNLNWVSDLWDWIQVAGPLAVARELDGLCANAGNRATRVAACYLAANQFPGRCEGYLRAREGVNYGPGPAYLDRWRQRCRAEIPALVAGLRAGSLEYSHWGSLTPRRREETLRVFASGTDGAIREAACEAARTAGLAGRIPECDGG